MIMTQTIMTLVSQLQVRTEAVNFIKAEVPPDRILTVTPTMHVGSAHPSLSAMLQYSVMMHL
jgi:hypothetical protein